MAELIAEDLLTPSTCTCSVSRGALADVLAGADPASLALAVGVPTGGLPTTAATADAFAAAGLVAEEVASAWEPSAEPGALTTVALPPGARGTRVLVLVGTGGGSPDEMRAAGAALGRAVRGRSRLVTHLGSDVPTEALSALVEGVLLGGYALPRWTSRGPSRAAGEPVAVTLVGAHDSQVVDAAVIRSRATLLARNLAITPSNIKNPVWMAAQAAAVAERSRLAIRTWNGADLHREGFGGLLAVGGGSASPPRLVRLDWEPGGATRHTPRVVLVGKGITFDSGGLDIKPAEGMLTMKTDMSGSASVLAVLSACRDLAVPVRVTGLLALAENAVGAGAYRPGDVITQYGGRTVEIGNTDAEGRIVMADALAYADRELEPDVLLDIATLTGAARVALGRSMAPVYSTDDTLREALVEAGERTGELLWPFPLVADYRPALDSDVADVNHVTDKAYGGGSITAALFLREFVGDRSWAHLDIAAVGRSDEDSGIFGKGASGFGTRLLLSWLEGMA